jgi:phytoene desaturase
MVKLLDHAFARLGLNRHELLPLRKITANLSSTLPDATVITLRDGFDLEVTGRAVDVKRLQSELRRMVESWQPVLRFISEELLTPSILVMARATEGLASYP